MLPCVSALPSLCNGTIDIPQRAVSSKQSFHPIMFLSRDCRFMSFANLVCLVLSRLYPFSMCCLRVMVFIWSVLKRDSFLWPPMASKGFQRPPFPSFLSDHFQMVVNDSVHFPFLLLTRLCLKSLLHSFLESNPPVVSISILISPNLFQSLSFLSNLFLSYVSFISIEIREFPSCGFLWISVDICGFFRTFMHSNGFVGSLGIV